MHLKSGLPTASPGDVAADQRKEDTAFLASWLEQAPNLGSDDFTRPPADDVILLGDFNAVEKNFSVAPLYTASFAWQKPQAVTVRDAPKPSALQSVGEQWSIFPYRKVINHAVVSVGVAPRVSLALIYAFDQDPALDEAPAAAVHWLRRRTDYELIPSQFQEKQKVPNLYRISDHRPVRVSAHDA